jgi:hypothetical protein
LYAAGDIRSTIGVQKRCALFDGNIDVADALQGFILDLGGVYRIHGSGSVIRHHNSNGFPNVANLVAGQHRARRTLQTRRRRIRQRPAQLSEVCESERAYHAWHRPSDSQPNTLDPRVRVNRTDHRNMQHSRQIDVPGVLAATRQERPILTP